MYFFHTIGAVYSHHRKINTSQLEYVYSKSFSQMDFVTYFALSI